MFDNFRPTTGMHRLSSAVRPYQRTLSSLSQVPSRTTHPPNNAHPPIPPLSPPPVPPASATHDSSSTLRPVSVDFFEDDLLNEIYAPSITTLDPDDEDDVRVAQTRMADALLYGVDEDDAYNRQIQLEEETINIAVERLRKMTTAASSRGDVVTHRSANDLMLAWFNPFILALRSLQEKVSDDLKANTADNAPKTSESDVEASSSSANSTTRNAASNSTSTPKRPRSSTMRKADEEVHRVLSSFPAETVAVIVVHTLLSAMMREAANGLPLTRAANIVSEAVNAEINLKKIVKLRNQHLREQEQRDAALTELSSTSKVGSGGDGKGAKRGRGRPSTSSGSAVARSILDRARKASTLSLASAVNFASARALDREATWDAREHVLLGTKLIEVLMNVARVKDDDGHFVPAITHSIRVRKSDSGKVGVLLFSDAAMSLMMDDTPSSTSDYVSPKQQPMVVKPRPWTSPSDGAYLRCQSYMVRRAPGSHREVETLLQGADLSTVFGGLNALGEQEWRVNHNVLEPAQTLWDRGGGVAGLVTKTNCDVPEKKAFLAAEFASFEQRRRNAEREMMLAPQDEEELDVDVDDQDSEADAETVSAAEANNIVENDEFDEKEALRKLRAERRKAQKMNRELVSMRADTEHRMRQAQRFAEEERIWLPHNVDFRGRAYPVPVHLQHMGCDLTRALLTFARPGVPLGERGVYWLKIHLANLLGADKLSLAERIDVAEDSMARVLQVGQDPLSDTNLEWWANAEDPFQLLAACCEAAQACGRGGGERAMQGYESTLPISMDGSCNGLQHYAALGRDVEGGAQVNLVPGDRPQDVYSGIARLVGDKVEQLALEGDEFGLLMRGRVTRKIVKQTVMTSVYGVTLVGARQQIMNKLAELEGDATIPEDKLFRTSSRLAQLTLSSLGDIFAGATETMEWLYECARRISKAGHKVQWTTPVGLPVMQPYRRSERKVVQTLMQRVTLQRTGEHSPVSTARQRSAFPPNYVHSIDSAHMLLTAVTCRHGGGACGSSPLNFAAVHDSFWTNAAHVDAMNAVLRDEFVKLHQRDLLRELRETFLLRYPNVRFSALPERGRLDLADVRHSDYFFS